MRIENALISVIVPVYNVEKYLEKCIDSICNQTYRNLEIILVNDGSTDKSGILCGKFKIKDSRIIVIHKENGGLSDARNAGIDIANGEVLGFVDSDDYIMPEMYEKMLNIMYANDLDIVQCGYKKVYENYDNINDIFINKTDIKIFNRNEAFEHFCDNNILKAVSWNKIYKKELFNNIRFPKGKIHEDEFTTPRLILESNKVACIQAEYYRYLQRESSIMNSKYSIRNLDIIDVYSSRCNLISRYEEYKHLLPFIKYHYCINIGIQFAKMRKSNFNLEGFKVKELKNIQKVLMKELLFNNTVSMIKKIKLLMFYMVPSLSFYILCQRRK